MLITGPHLVPKLRKSDVMLSLPHIPSWHSQGQHHLHVFIDFCSFTLCSMLTALYIPSRNLRLASVKMQKTRTVDCLCRWLQNESYNVLKFLYLGPLQRWCFNCRDHVIYMVTFLNVLNTWIYTKSDLHDSRHNSSHGQSNLSVVASTLFRNAVQLIFTYRSQK
jgi:hypothetical protein